MSEAALKQRVEDLEEVLRALLLHMMVRPENRVRAVEEGLRQYATEVLNNKEAQMGHVSQKSFEELAKEEGTTPEAIAEQVKIADEITAEVIAEEKASTEKKGE